MGVEIERKYLVKGDGWRAAASRATHLRQGYFRAEDATVRVRICDEEGVFTVKGRAVGVTRGEWEWPIPKADAEELLERFCRGRVLDKTRHHVHAGGKDWVVDVFHGAHDGLVLAEIELASDDEAFELPEWVGEEVSEDPAYFNSSLAGSG